MTRFSVDSAESMHAAGESLGRILQSGDIVGLVGDLGMGKTVFVKGLARGLGIPGDVTSPTFTLVNEYDGGRLRLYHVDLYRIETAAELANIGIPDLYGEAGVFAVEWADKFPPPERLELRITGDGSERQVETIAHGAVAARLAGWPGA